MTNTDWTAIATHIDQRRAVYVQHGEDYTTATTKAFRDELHSLVEAASQVDAQLAEANRWASKATEAELEAGRLRQKLDVTAVDRVTAVLATVADVPRQKTATHHDTCWQKHPGCLAARIARQIEGQE